MIINLNGTVVDKEIKFDFCPVYFLSTNFVHVNELFIVFKNKVKNLHGYIQTSLIDQSTVNLNQQIVFFQHKVESNYMYYSPTHLSKYKVQCTSLHESVFQIHLSENHEIEKIYLQIEITNARI